MQVAYTPAEIAEFVGAQRTAGSTGQVIHDIASLTSARVGDLSFLGNAKYRSQVEASHATALLLPLDYAGQPKPGQVFLFVENPSAALAKVCARIEAALWPKPAPGVHPSAVVAPTAAVDATAYIGPLCVVEDGARIGAGSVLQGSVYLGRETRVGAGCFLMPGVVVADGCVLGNRVRLQPGVVVGSDGFGYEFVKGRHEKIPQIGIVVIEDDVEIGANSALDRARFSRTVVGEGTKIDNLVQIAHNVVIGRHCVIVSGVGISGSTTLEDYVVLGGQVGVVGHLRIGRGSQIAGSSNVNRDVPPGSRWGGTPAKPVRAWFRELTTLARLAERSGKDQAGDDA